MTRYVNISKSCAAIALIGWAAASLQAQQPSGGGRGQSNPPSTQGGSAPGQPAGGQPAQPTRQGGGRGAGSTEGPAVPAGTSVTNLGPVHIAKAVKADGQALPAGT